MTTRNLEYLLAPRSVAVIGASDRPASVGAMVIRNLLAGGFRGPVWSVNRRHRQVAGQTAYARVGDLPQAPDLAVICTPPPTLPGLIAELGARGTRAAVVLTAGVAVPGEGGADLIRHMLEAARPHLMRILGPNCVGLLVPGIGLNASFAHIAAKPGKLAFVSQSGALVTAVLDWADFRNIGFSHFISVGDRADVDFGDLIDYLGSDAGTSAILLYIESIKTPRKFLSAARAASRNKPVIVVKSGRAPEGALAAASHSGALAGDDEVFDAAIRRAGMLRVDSLLDLFVAVETLARAPKLKGDRLLIVTNGGGAGVLAADAVMLGGARLGALSKDTLRRLNAVLPPAWSRSNPVDIVGDAPVERYVAALEVLADCPDGDAVLFMHAPSAIVPAEAIAAACLPLAERARLPVFSCWMGSRSVETAARMFREAGIPSFPTPEVAVQAFVQMLTYRRNQDQLLQAPPASDEPPAPEASAARTLIHAALANGREWLSDPDTKRILAIYGIPVVHTRVVATAEAAAAAAEAIGFPVALKILSPDITHKSDVGGVALDLDNATALRAAAAAMSERVRRLRPDAHVEGYTVQAMVRRPRAHEVIVGVGSDPQFGPVVLFGHGGTAVEVVADRAVGLPPLNEALAKELVSRTRIARLLAGYRDRPAVDLPALYEVLVAVSHMLTELPELVELDINPLLVDEAGVIAVDARMRLAPARRPGAERLAIRPYPRELAERVLWQDKPILLRPIRPEDEARHLAFLEKLDPEDIRMRVFSVRRSIERSELARLTQIDYEREMAFVALAPGPGGTPETLGIVRAVTDPDNHCADFGIVIRSDLKGRGLGSLLVKKMIAYCRDRGTRELAGDVLAVNTAMLAFARIHGFRSTPTADSDIVHIRLPLQGDATH